MLNQLFQIAIMNDTNQALGCCGIPARLANAQSMVLFYNKQASSNVVHTVDLARAAARLKLDSS
jgi:hypothetical protein